MLVTSPAAKMKNFFRPTNKMSVKLLNSALQGCKELGYILLCSKNTGTGLYDNFWGGGSDHMIFQDVHNYTQPI